MVDKREEEKPTPPARPTPEPQGPKPKPQTDPVDPGVPEDPGKKP